MYVESKPNSISKTNELRYNLLLQKPNNVHTTKSLTMRTKCKRIDVPTLHFILPTYRFKIGNNITLLCTYCVHVIKYGVENVKIRVARVANRML